MYIDDIKQGDKTMAIRLTSVNGSSQRKVHKYMEAVHPEMEISIHMATRIANDMMDKTDRRHLAPLGKREFARIIEEVLSENTYINEWPYKVR
jgi:hypothetical protein